MCNLLNGISKDIRMIHTDIGDDGHNGSNNIRYVHPSPKPSLPYYNIGVTLFRII
ncbi:hypothetical protein D3C74_455440 [compost metagenome]